MIAISKSIGKGRVNLLCYEINNSQGNGCSMKIQEIEITDIGGIPYLKLDNLDPHMNIICGENGVGKTTVLDVLSFLFSRHTLLLKKRSGSAIGKIGISGVDCNNEDFKVDRELDVFEPDKKTSFLDQKYIKNQKLLINIPVNRVFSYIRMRSLEPFPETDSYNNQDKLRGISSDYLKNWFVLKHWRHVANELSGIEEYNIKKAKEFISKLDSRIFFSKVDDFFNIIVSSNGEDIYLEYLSSGFKSAFYILLGILNEIEYMHGKDTMPADEYSGIVLIDELELHLHPIWQQKIIQILKAEFPKVQFFITSHSPHIIQSAKYSEIIVLEKKDALESNIPFEVVKRDLKGSEKYGFQGWSIEEILEDIMGMETTYGEDYLEQRRLFEEALDNNNREQAQSAFNEIVQMIHPNSPIRKVMEIQLVSLG